MKFFIERIDDTNVMTAGLAETRESAIMLAQALIDEYLEWQSCYHKSAHALYSQYKEAGPVLCIFFGDFEYLDGETFDPWDYASRQCEKLCGEDDAMPMLITESLEKHVAQWQNVSSVVVKI